MKNLSILFSVLLFVGFSCGTTDNLPQTEMETETVKKGVESIRLSQSKRGGIKEITMSLESVNYAMQGATQQFSLSETRWAELMEIVEQLDIEAISQLESPTNDRASDRAKIGILEIVVDGTSYQHHFDNLNSHKDLLPLIEQIKIICKEDFEIEF